VDEVLLGQGYGAARLNRAEQEAREAGCVAARLDTYGFQARPFYQRHGHTVHGVLDGYPAGARQYSLRKALR
jgi:GNAT superfamily N-acetyltransferase